ncbi:MAG: L-lactate dehydrogenase [bacterium]
MTKFTPKVAIVGTGYVGATFAYALAISGLARQIVLIDKNEDRAKGEAMDLNHSLPFISPVDIDTAGFEGCQDADIVVICAGSNQKPGETRIDLVKRNTEIFKGIIPQIVKYTQDSSILLVVSNPVDILSYVTYKVSGFPSNRVLGSGTVLDSSRLRYLLSKHCQVDSRNVHAYIIGEHGDTELPAWSSAFIGGIRFKEYCPLCNQQCNYKNDLNSIFEEVKNAAYKIIKYKGATYYAIGLSLVRIIEAIIRDENSILPVSTLINGYLDINDIYLSLPSIVHKKGVKKVLHLPLDSNEMELLKRSASSLKNVLKEIGFINTTTSSFQ